MEREKLQKSYGEIGINVIVTNGTYMTTVQNSQMVHRKRNTQLKHSSFFLYPTLATLLVFFLAALRNWFCIFCTHSDSRKNAHTHTQQLKCERLNDCHKKSHIGWQSEMDMSIFICFIACFQKSDEYEPQDCLLFTVELLPSFFFAWFLS